MRRLESAPGLLSAFFCEWTMKASPELPLLALEVVLSWEQPLLLIHGSFNFFIYIGVEL